MCRLGTTDIKRRSILSRRVRASFVLVVIVNLRQAVVYALSERAFRSVVDRVWVVSSAEPRVGRWLGGSRPHWLSNEAWFLRSTVTQKGQGTVYAGRWASVIYG
jgi:hypothetical protein